MSYINKEDLLATINEVWERKYARCNYKLLYDVYRMVIRRINRAPVADAIEVVRCENCKFYKPFEKVEDFDGKCILHGIEIDKEFYCQYGAKKAE